MKPWIEVDWQDFEKHKDVHVHIMLDHVSWFRPDPNKSSCTRIHISYGETHFCYNGTVDEFSKLMEHWYEYKIANGIT